VAPQSWRRKRAGNSRRPRPGLSGWMSGCRPLGHLGHHKWISLLSLSLPIIYICIYIYIIYIYRYIYVIYIYVNIYIYIMYYIYYIYTHTYNRYIYSIYHVDPCGMGQNSMTWRTTFFFFISRFNIKHPIILVLNLDA
jgi:hypothetical protein